VLWAELPEEVAALDQRYLAAQSSAENRNCIVQFREFEDLVRTSKAVFACSLRKLEPIIASDRDLYATYHDLRRLRFGLPSSPPAGPDWDIIRPVAETALFGEEPKRHIHYAALSLTDAGLPGYGECAVVLREDRIADRTSVFEENSLVFMQKHRILVWDTDKLPRGFRATWPDRHRLAAAKLGARIDSAKTAADFQEILLKSRPDKIDDEFVEVHVFGPMTLKTFAKVTVTRKGRTPSQTRLNVLRDRLERDSVPLEVQ
jgi:hypothetical protein